MNGAPRQRCAPSTSPAATSALIRVEETVSPPPRPAARRAVSNSSARASSSGVPFAFAPKRKFSPTETCSAPSSPTRISRAEVLRGDRRRTPGRRGSRRARRRPSPSITSRLIGNGMISFGVASGWITESGWGSNVSTVSAPSITSRWPTWTPSKLPIAILRGRGSASSRVCDLDVHPISLMRLYSITASTTSVARAVSAPCGDRDEPPSQRQPRGAVGCPPVAVGQRRSGSRCGPAAPLPRSSSIAGRNGSSSSTGRIVGGSSPSAPGVRSPIAVRRSSSQ